MADDFRHDYAAARAGDADAASRLLAPQLPRIERFVARQLGAAHRRARDPEDVVQTTLLALLDRIPGWPEDLEEDEFLARVLQTARWRLLDAVSSPAERGESVFAREERPAPEVSRGPVTRADDREWTRKHIRELDELYRVVLEAYYVEGVEVAEIARRLTLSRDAVRQRLSRGRKILEERWLGRDRRHDPTP